MINQRRSTYPDREPVQTNRATSGFGWATLDRLHAADLISEPAGNAKSVVLTEQGLARARAEFDRLFVAGAA